MGNQWAWWGDPDQLRRASSPARTWTACPDGGAFDGPLGVVSAFAAIDRAARLAASGRGRPIGVVNFVDEEGARFGVACAGSRVITGVLARRSGAGAAPMPSGRTMAEACARPADSPRTAGPDPETLGRIGQFVELHVEQGRGLIDLGRAVAVGSGIWPHGRWRIESRVRPTTPAPPG